MYNYYIQYFMLQGFRNLLPRNIVSDQSFTPILKKTEQYRKLTQHSTDLASSIQKIFENNSQHCRKIMDHTRKQLQNLGYTDHPSYFNTIFMLYADNVNLLEQFSNNIQQYLSQLASSNKSSFVNFSACLLVLQQQIKSYLGSEATCGEMSKKYHKTLKNLSNSLQSYKVSFNEAKLIYNIDEKIRRYHYCQQNYRTVKQELNVISELAVKLNSKKQQIINTYINISEQYQDNQVIANIKLYKFLSYFGRGFCQLMREKITVISAQKKLLQELNPQNFLSIKLKIRTSQEQEQNVQRSYTLSQALNEFSSFQPQNHQLRLSMFMRSLEQALENDKKFHKITQQLHTQLYRALQKNFINNLKEVISYFQKNKKKIKEMFMEDVIRLQKNVKSMLKQVIAVSESYLKKIWSRLDRAHTVIIEKNNIVKIMMQQLKTYSQKLISFGPTTQPQQLLLKYEFFGLLIMGFDEKINKQLEKIKIAYNDIVQDLELGIIEVENLCREFVENERDQGEIVEKMRLMVLEKFKNLVFDDLKKEDTKKKLEFVEDNMDKIQEFTKLKKPVEIQIAEKQSSPRDNTNKLSMGENVNTGAQDSMMMQNQVSSPTKNNKASKHLQFLTSKVSFLQDEQLLKVFSCALADKIILQGKLYVTSHRLCFSSNFNAGNVFFGGTFIQIPIKDIITFQKRKNGIFFDNSISITTINGEVFFTSFFKRNEAHELISKLTGKNLEQVFYEQEDQDEDKDSSRVSECLHEQQQADDLKQQNVTARAQQIQKLLFKHPYKVCAETQIYGQKLNAYKMLRLFIIDQQVTVSRKKYESFSVYFKKMILEHKNIEQTEFDPSFAGFLNPDTIKDNCPLFFTKKLSSIVPLANSGIPFMPKTAKTSQETKVYVISKHQWITESQIENSGAPYTDCFRVYIRNVCESNNEGICKLKTCIYLDFIKNTMMKGVIESKSFEQTSLQMNKLYEQYKKYISNLNKQKKRISKNQQQNIGGQQQSKYQLIEENRSLQEKIEEQEKQFQKLKKSLAEIQGSDKLKMKIIVIGLIVYILTVVALVIWK